MNFIPKGGPPLQRPISKEEGDAAFTKASATKLMDLFTWTT